MIMMRLHDGETPPDIDDNNTADSAELNRRLPTMLIGLEQVRQMRERRRQLDALRQWDASRARAAS